MKLILQLLGVRSDFEKLFFLNEYKTLAGEGRRIVLMLILILFLTLVALGFAVGSMQNLERKMNNPFTNWVDLSISEEYISRQAGDIQQRYGSGEMKEKLQLDDVTGWVIYSMEVFHRDFDPLTNSTDTLAYAAWGRSPDGKDPILEKVISVENLLWKSNAHDFTATGLQNCEIILTAEMMQRLGYNPQNENVGHIFIREGDNFIPVEVVAVIKELPKFCDFVTSPEFYNIKNAKRDGRKNCGQYLRKENEGASSFVFLVNDKLDATELRQEMTRYFPDIEPPEVRTTEAFSADEKKYLYCEVDFLPSQTPARDSLMTFIQISKRGDNPLSEFIKPECGTGFCDKLDSEDYYYLAFNFNRLDDIRRFRDDIKANYNVDIDMSQVEAKENFALVSRLTLIISLILLAFGILSIILFVNSLLRAHLFKIRSNLGTCKAFGLSNRFLNTIYLKIIFTFLTLSVVIAFVLSVFIDRIERFVMVDESQFNIFNYWVAAAVVALLCISIFISSQTIKKILGDTPGNLIYER